MNAEAREVHLLSGVYALDAVTPEEARAVEAAMRDSEELRGEIVGLTDTAVTLGLAARAEAPSPALRASLLDLIETTPQLPVEEPDVEVSAPDRAAQHLVPRRRRRMLRRPAVLLSAAAVALLLFGGGVLVQRAAVEPQLDYGRVVAAADAQEHSVPVEGGGRMTVVSSRSEDATAVSFKGVTVPSGHTLQLWSVRGTTVTSEGVVGGSVDLLHRLPAAGERLAVSVEPAGGSERPTTTPIATVSLGA